MDGVCSVEFDPPAIDGASGPISSVLVNIQRIFKLSGRYYNILTGLATSDSTVGMVGVCSVEFDPPAIDGTTGR